MQSIETFNQDLLTFLDASPTPFHAVKEMAARLKTVGFEQLSEADEWQLTAGGRYYVIRNSSSIVAFNFTGQAVIENGFRLIGAHTDSPCLRVKPNPEIHQNNYFQLGVEVYGGALLNPWFDRDLSLAGRVSYRDSSGAIKSTLINFERAIAVIPSLAIHLDREANKKRGVNEQKDIPPVLMVSKGKQDFKELLADQLRLEHNTIDVEKILDYELSFYDTQVAAVVGLNKDFIASARLDNLLSCYIGLQALLSADQQSCVLVCNDHEEVGSVSAVGAQGPMLQSILRRIVDSDDSLTRALHHSMMISADNAHGIHPNFADKHDGNHGPILNSGPVIKTNANQRYATNSETSALFQQMAETAEESVQTFVVRTDMACGSTIGPVTAAEIGVSTLDVGVPTFGMHSIRELGGSNDAYALYRILSVFNGESSVCVAE